MKIARVVLTCALMGAAVAGHAEPEGANGQRGAKAQLADMAKALGVSDVAAIPIEAAGTPAPAGISIQLASALPVDSGSDCRPAPASEIPTPPELPWVTGQDGPWDVLGNGLLFLTYGESEGLARVKAYHILVRETTEPKDLARIASIAQLDNSRAFTVAYSDHYYVYWARSSALFYHVRQKDGETFRIYKDAEQDGVNGNEVFCGQFVEAPRSRKN